MSNGRAGSKDLVSSGSPAAIFVRHQAASSNCSKSMNDLNKRDYQLSIVIYHANDQLQLYNNKKVLFIYNNKQITCSSDDPKDRYCTKSGIAPALIAASTGGTSDCDSKSLKARSISVFFF